MTKGTTKEQIAAIKQDIADGRLVPSSIGREFTVAGSPSPTVGDVWLLAGEPYLVTDVSGDGLKWLGQLRHLAKPPTS